MAIVERSIQQGSRITEGLRHKEVDIFFPRAVEHWLSVIRNERTSVSRFRQNADMIAFALGMHLAEDLPIRTEPIQTPCGPTDGKYVDSRGVLLVGILRSGYPLCKGIQGALTDATIALVDIKRDEKTAEPHLNYDGLPASLSDFDRVIIPDPMLATGGSATMTIEMLKARGAKNIHLVSIVAASEGVTRIQREHPGVKITTCAQDPRLNESKYIVPGLGDFGDRYFDNEVVKIPDTNTGELLIYHAGRFTTKPLLEVN